MTNALGDLICRGEGGYNSYNRGTSHGHIVPANRAVDFSSISLRELLARQGLAGGNDEKLFAVGKYQVIPTTMLDAVDRLHLKLDEKFTPQLQERIFSDFLIGDKRPEIRNYIVGSAGATLHGAQKSVSKEWASVDDPDTPGRPYGTYALHGNRSTIRAGQIEEALNQMRDAYQADVARGMSPADAWRAVTGQDHGVQHETPMTQGSESARMPDDSRISLRTPTGATGAAFRVGAVGAQVESLQQLLSKIGYRNPDASPLAVDGKFGPGTRHAVEAFQREHGLHVDGVVGRGTRGVMAAIQANPFTSRFHPQHALYSQALSGVHAEESRRGLQHGEHSERLAGALTVGASGAGLIRIDRVELNTTGTLARAVQVSTLRDEPGLNRSSPPIATGEALRAPLAEAAAARSQAIDPQVPAQAQVAAQLLARPPRIQFGPM